MRIGIKAKLGAAFGVIIVMLIAMSLIATSSLTAFDSRVSRMIAEPVQRSVIASSVQENILRLARASRDLLLVHSDAEVQAVLPRIAEIRRELDTQLPQLEIIAGDEFVDSARALQAEIDLVFAGLDQMIPLAREKTQEAATALSINEGADVANAFITALEDIQNLPFAQMGMDANLAFAQVLEIERIFWRSMLSKMYIVLSTDDENIRAFDAEYSSQAALLDVAIADLTATMGVSGQAELQSLLMAHEEYKTVSEDIRRIGALNSNERAYASLLVDIRPPADTATDLLHAIIEGTTEEMGAESNSLSVLYANSNTLLMAISGLSILIGSVAAIWISLSLSRGIGRAVEVARSVAKGNLAVDTTSKSNDEIGDLFVAMSDMTASMSEMADLAEKLAKGDLTVDSRPRSDVDALGNALQEMILRLRNVVANAQTSSEGVASGAQAMSATAEQLNQGATEQAAAAEQASAAMEQMTANIRQSADNASQTEKIAT